MYRNKVIIRKIEVIPPINDSMIPVDFFQKKSIINFTTDDMTSKFELFYKNKMNNTYITEIMRIDWLKILDEYWDKKDTLHSDGFDFWPGRLFQYYNGLPLGDAIEIAHLVGKSEQHRLTPKYDIMCSLLPFVKNIL